MNPSRHRFVAEEWIDVIPLIEPTSDKLNIPRVTGKNDWRVEHSELLIARDPKGSKLIFPLDSQWTSFECEIDFTRRAGESGFNFNNPTETGYCPLVIDAPGTPGGVYLGSKSKSVVLQEGPRIVTSQRSIMRIRVDTSQNVAVDFDDAVAGSWTGNCDSISSTTSEGYLHARRLSLWIHPGGNDFVFHRIRVRTLGDRSADTIRPFAPVRNSE